eukprot:924779-Pleurochrysis_carterae.AAC.2
MHQVLRAREALAASTLAAVVAAASGMAAAALVRVRGRRRSRRLPEGSRALHLYQSKELDELRL